MPKSSGYGRDLRNSIPKALGVLDEFSRQCFSGSLEFFALGLDEEPIVYDYLNPEFLLFESAWNGNSASWRHMLAGPRAPKESVVRALDAAKAADTPTVFWNKEDPPHFEDFVETARLFDFIFTTESAKIDEYKRAAGHDRVALLRFAAAPQIHNPARGEGYRSGEVAFAGQYFAHKFPERRAQMDYLFPAASRFDFSIYSRVLGGSADYQFPRDYADRIVGSLPYSEMVGAYKKHKVFLNVNSVPDSESMCARRVFELASAKTLVVSAPTPAISAVYSADEVLQVRDQRAAIEALESHLEDEGLRRTATQKAWRRTAAGHTYAHRVDEIRRALGRNVERFAPEVSLFAQLRSVDELVGALLSLSSQTATMNGSVRLKLVAIMAGGLEHSSIGSIWGEFPGNVVVVPDVQSALMEISGDYWGPWSRDLSYGRFYLEDLLHYFRGYTAADLIAKPGTFATLSYNEAENAVEETYGREVLRGAWLVTRNRGARAEDLEFGLSSGLEIGEHPQGTAYRADAFNVWAAASSQDKRWES